MARLVNGKACSPMGPANARPARAPASPPSHKTVRSRCSCRLNRLTTPPVLPWLCRFAAGLSPASSTGASLGEFGHQRVEVVQRFGRFLVLFVLLRFRHSVRLGLLRLPVDCVFHDHSPLGSSLPCKSGLTLQARRS